MTTAAKAQIPDIAAGRLSAETYQQNFDDMHPVLPRKNALVEADRCYFCYDAPCMEACPTGIDIPGFIKKIATDNVVGSAVRILEANIFGGSCARVCPTEILCEQACVRTAKEGKPVQIGRLQRYATDHLLERNTHPFTRAPRTGKRVAVVGGGPAGLSCAHRLAMLGHDVVVFEARDQLGGLNEYGIAEYKVPHHYARREVDFILRIGGIETKTRQQLGRDIHLDTLRKDFDAVFLGIGLAGVRALGADGEALNGVHNAVDYIARLRQSDDFAKLPVGRRVVVIGGGNTAIDIAIQTKRLGAEDVTLVYRRGPEDMSATGHEQEFAQTEGVKIKHWARPVRLTGTDNHVSEAVFEYTKADKNGGAAGTGETFTLAADMIFKAIGQVFVKDPLVANGRDLLEIKDGKIKVDADGRTSLDKVWAGGDCIAGQDLTVAAVEGGKRAAMAIDRNLRS